MKFRYGTLKDVNWLVEKLGVSMYELHGTSNLYDEKYLKEVFAPGIIQNGIVIVAEKEGILVGAIAGMLTPFIYNPSVLVLAELVWWVEENHRNSSAGIRLLKYFELWGIEHGAEQITMSLMPNTELNDNALIKRGYTFREKGYMKGIK